MSSRSCVEAHQTHTAPAALRRPAIERSLDDALRATTTGMVLLRGPRGTGRRTAVTLWTRRLVRDGTAVVRVELRESESIDGEMLAAAVRAGLMFMTGEPAAPAPARGWTPKDIATVLDARETVLVVDRLGPASEAALSFLDRVARPLRRSRVVALTAMPLRGPDSSTAAPVELNPRDLSVSAYEAKTAAASLGVPLSDSQAHLLVTATAGWPAMVYPALDELRRTSPADAAVPDELVAAAAAAHRAAFLRDALPDEALAVLVEASLSHRFTWHELEATGLLSTVPEVFLDRLVDAGVVLEDPAGEDLAVEPHLRRALLGYAHVHDVGLRRAS